MTAKKITFTRAGVLARIQAGPIRYADLADSKSHAVRKRLRSIVTDLEQEGLVTKITLDGFPHYVTADWTIPDDLRVQLILNGCKPIDGCMVWTGYVNDKRGPIVRFGQEPPKAARRVVWQAKNGPLKHGQTVKVKPCCDFACVEYDHMVIVSKSFPTKGRNITQLHRSRIAAACRRDSKLDWDMVRAIRSSDEDGTVLAKRYGVSTSTINQVLRNETWQEIGGMFTSLLRAA